MQNSSFVAEFYIKRIKWSITLFAIKKYNQMEPTLQK